MATTVLITCEVVTRYLFRQPFGWSVEVSEWALLAMTFLGAGWVLRQDGHVRVDVLVNALGGRTRAIADLAAALVSFAVCALALFYTTKTTFGEYQSGVMTIQLLRFPRFWLLAFIPLGFLFLALEWLRQLLRALEALRHARG